MAISEIGGLSGLDRVRLAQFNVRKPVATDDGKIDPAANGGAPKKPGSISAPAADARSSVAEGQAIASGPASLASNSLRYERQDQNKDDIVTDAERIAYTIKHPGAETGNFVNDEA